MNLDCHKQVCPLMSRRQPQRCWPDLTIFVDPGTIAPAVGPLVSAATATASKIVKVSIPVSTVPFGSHSPIVSTSGQLPCHGVNKMSVTSFLLCQLKPLVLISSPSLTACSKIWSLLLGLLQSMPKNFGVNCTFILIKPRWIK